MVSTRQNPAPVKRYPAPRLHDVVDSRGDVVHVTSWLLGHSILALDSTQPTLQQCLGWGVGPELRILENPHRCVIRIVHRVTRPLRGSVSCGSGWSVPCVSIQLTLSQQSLATVNRHKMRSETRHATHSNEEIRPWSHDPPNLVIHLEAHAPPQNLLLHA